MPPSLNPGMPPLTAAQQSLVAQNLGWAYRMAHDLVRKRPYLEAYREDLEQVALLGLMRASQKYDPTKGAKFCTYARHWIFAYLSNEMRRLPETVRVPHQNGKQLPPRDVVDDAALAYVRAPQADPDDELDAARLYPRLAAYLESEGVSEHDRRIFFDVFSERLTVAEVSRRNGYSHQWASQRYLRTLRKAQRWMAEVREEAA